MYYWITALIIAITISMFDGYNGEFESVAIFIILVNVIENNLRISRIQRKLDE